MVAVPAGYNDLLERPLYGHLATTRPDATDWVVIVVRPTGFSKH